MDRPKFLKQIEKLFKTHKIVALLGPRQCGKTTLAKSYCREEKDFKKENYFDLESSVDLERLKNPMLIFPRLTGLIVIDEIQRIHDLFPILRELRDEENSDQRYLILGSASRELIQQSSESLAGRIAYLEITPFSFDEVHKLDPLWLRGGFPKSYLAENDEDSFIWREFYIRTYLEQDLPNLGINIAPQALRRFWVMLSNYHGNIFNASELGRSFGVSDKTIRHYLDILTGTFMIRQLLPWHANITKRQVKAPKIYFRDSGLLHSLLNIENESELYLNPKLGASWEGFALEQIIRNSSSFNQEYFFWSTYSGAELDLLVVKGSKLVGFEFKFTDAPKITKSMQISLNDLELEHLYVIYPGNVDYLLSENITVMGLQSYLDKNIGK